MNTEQRFAFAIGDQIFSRKGCLRSLSVNYSRDICNGLGYGYCQSAQHEIDVNIVVTESSLSESNGKFPIRNKYVGDCSIDELLFAIQSKIKKEKSK